MNRRNLIRIIAVEIMLVPFALWAGDDDRSHRRPGGPRPAMTDEQVADVLEFVKAHWPEYHTRLRQVRRENPRRFRMMIRAAAHRMKQFTSLSEEEREARIRESKLKIEIYRLSKQYRSAETDERKQAIRAELKQTVGEAFDVEQTVREYSLQRLESQLRQLRRDLGKRAERRDEIISERVEDIIRARYRVFRDRRPDRRRSADGPMRGGPSHERPDDADPDDEPEF
ncbi:MAG: hypothetical protein GVY16_11915 [Planctomycetes bacterium]|jgi:hypothetical protein|nr:hypothetical protein [Planctomycetota bacterium]